MKVLFFIESLKAGGKERRLVELIKGLSSYSDIQIVIVVLSKDVHYKEITDLNVIIHYLDRKRNSRNFNIFFRFMFFVKSTKPDLVHVWGNVSGIYTIPAKIFLKFKLINSQITDAPKNFNLSLTYKLNFFFADLIISNSKAGLESYRIDSHKSIIINNGFNFQRINKISPSENLKIKFGISTKYIVGMVATFYELKDYPTYISAAIKILNDRKDISFLCIGAGDKTKYQKMVPSKFNDHILFLNEQNEIEAIMDLCDIGVLSTYTEGIPNSVMEFMALGKAVIATNGGGVKELVTNEKTGYLVSEKDSNDLSSRILELINNPELSFKMGRAAKKRIKKNFNISRMVISYYTNYKKLCAE